MTQSSDREIADLKTTVDANVKAIDANNKAIADLALTINGLREEMRVGFTKSEGQINNVETKLDAKIDVVRGELRVLDVKTEQKPMKVGFWTLLVRWVAILSFGSLFVAFLLS